MVKENNYITKEEFATELDKIRRVCEEDEYEVFAGLSDSPDYRELQMAVCGVLILEHYKRNTEFDIVDMFKKLEYVHAPIAAFLFSKEIYEFAEKLKLDVPLDLIDEYTNLLYLGETTKRGFHVDAKINSYLRDQIIVPFAQKTIKEHF